MDNSHRNRSEQSPALEVKQCTCAVCSTPFNDGRGRHVGSVNSRPGFGKRATRTFAHLGHVRAPHGADFQNPVLHQRQRDGVLVASDEPEGSVYWVEDPVPAVAAPAFAFGVLPEKCQSLVRANKEAELGNAGTYLCR